MIFNSEQKLVQDMVRKFAINKLAPTALELDKKASTKLTDLLYKKIGSFRGKSK